MDPRRSHPPQQHLPSAMQPKTNAPAQNPRPLAPIPPVKWANNMAAAQRQTPGMTITASSSVPILSGRWCHDSGSVQPRGGGPYPPQRASGLVPPVRMPDAPGAVQPQLAASSPPKQSTAPIPPVRMPHAAAPRFELQPKVAPSGSIRMAAPEARPFPRPRPIASFIQRMDVDDAFEVPAEYRPPPLPTLWDWIEGPLRRAEYERQYPTQVATITDVPVPVPQQGVLVPGPVPQQGVLVPAPVDIGALLKAKKWSKELSAALKEKYGDILGGEMARQMRIKPTTSEQELKKRAEEKVGQRESEV